MKIVESIQILLAANTYLYKIFQNIFGNEPSSMQLEVLTNEVTNASLDLLRLQDNREFDDSLRQLKNFALSFKNNKADVLDKVRMEYTRLLIGPERLPAPPWESVYLREERLLFQESTLEIRKYYLKYNFQPAEYPHVADDHLGLELDFMAKLSEMAEKSYKVEDFNTLLSLLQEQENFIKNHLIIWVPLFAEKMQESRTSYLYPNMAILLKQFLTIQLKVLNEIKENF